MIMGHASRPWDMIKREPPLSLSKGPSKTHLYQISRPRYRADVSLIKWYKCLLKLLGSWTIPNIALTLCLFPTKIILPPCAQGPLYLAGEACTVYDTFSNTCLQNYKFPLTLAQDLAEICYKKLQIGIFSAVDA